MEDYQRKDIKLLYDFFLKHGITTTTEELIDIWEEVSSDMCAGWLGVDSYSENQLKEIIFGEP